ncbi:hypothetical protein FB451DRAFT_1086365 [Mycena latifolia]|nr:hypothetical protein FB451DRAFT_1086365 [Mycena latifolia]
MTTIVLVLSVSIMHSGRNYKTENVKRTAFCNYHDYHCPCGQLNGSNLIKWKYLTSRSPPHMNDDHSSTIQGEEAISDAVNDMGTWFIPPSPDRDLQIFAALERYMPLWSGSDFIPDVQFVGVVLGLVETCSRPADGSRNIQNVSRIDPQSFYRDLFEGHTRQEYQWIFDRFWSDRMVYPAELEEIVDQYCAEIEPLLRKYIQEKAPLESWSPDEKTEYSEFLSSLNIPFLKGGPDMLLHDLGSLSSNPDHQKRVKNIFGGGVTQHAVVLNTSGSGKTRLSLEGLCQSWGIYFTSCVDVQGHGSTDLYDSIKGIESDKGFTTTLPAEDYTKAHNINCAIAKRHLTSVLFARLVIFEKFCRLAKELNSGTLLEEHKKYWLLLQFKPSSLGDKSCDIFAELSRRIKGAEYAVLLDRCHNIVGTVNELITPINGRRPPIFCVIDEAQSAAGRCTKAFRSLRGSVERMRSILREMVAAWVLIAGIVIILVGTGMSKIAVEETMASALLKGGEVETIYDVGGFVDDEAQMDYMKSFMPDSLKETEEARAVLGLATYWLRGRFRFTAAFMRQLLVAGFKDMALILQEFMSASTAAPGRPEESVLCQNKGFVPTSGPLDALDRKNRKRVVKGLKSFNFERLREHEKLFDVIKVIVSKCYMRNDIAFAFELTTAEYDAVEYGFARFVAYQDSAHVTTKQLPHRVVLDEPLVVLALQQWLGEKDVAIHEGIALRARVGSQEANGPNGLEEYFAFYLSTVFDDVTPLCKIFRFHDIPEWATKPAKLVSLYRRAIPGNNSKTLESGRVLQGSRPSVGLGTGGNRHYTDLWLTHDVDTPFFFPDNFLGPDILFVLELGDEDKSRIWVAVQSKYSSKALLGKKTLEKALRSVTPSRFYLGEVKPTPKTDPEKDAAYRAKEDHKETMARLKKLPGRLEEVLGSPNAGAGLYSLLRVVAGWKSRINLHKRGTKKPPAKTPRKTAPSKKRQTTPLNYYSDAERHPVAELDIKYMAEKMRMLHPTDDADFDDPHWVGLPFVKKNTKKRLLVIPGFNGGPNKRTRLDAPGEESALAPPSTILDDSEMSELSDSQSDRMSEEELDHMSEEESDRMSEEEPDDAPEDAPPNKRPRLYAPGEDEGQSALAPPSTLLDDSEMSELSELSDSKSDRRFEEESGRMSEEELDRMSEDEPDAPEAVPPPSYAPANPLPQTDPLRRQTRGTTRSNPGIAVFEVYQDSRRPRRRP